MFRPLLLVLILTHQLTNTALFAKDGDGENTRCLQCHGNRPAVEPEGNARRAPLLPEKFSMKWRMYEFASKERPPFTKIPEPHAVLRGVTHYDWSRRAMTEIYLDRCIDIFPNGRDYRCQFTSIDGQTYLIRFATQKTPESCCLWNKAGFHAPRPDVVRNMSFEKFVRIGTKKAGAWILDIPLPGPFGYAFFERSGEPATFWFPVIAGWVQQDFHDFVETSPDPTVFALPSMCLGKQIAECGE